MKVPLKYQSTDYDCVPTTFINAINYLFDRKEIPPEVIQRIYMYSLDLIGKKGGDGTGGTSAPACEVLLNWLESFSESYSRVHNSFALQCEYIEKDDVNLGPKSKIIEYINAKGVALCTVFCNKEGIDHYILCTGYDEKFLYFFDPDYRDRNFKVNERHLYEWCKNKVSYNLRVSRSQLELRTCDRYTFGPINERTCCLIKRT